MMFSTLSRRCAQGIKGLSQTSSVLKYSTQSSLSNSCKFNQFGILQNAQTSNSFKITPALFKHFSTSQTNLNEVHAKGDHTTLWTIERFVSAGLLAVIPAAYLIPSTPLEYALVISIVMHTHWGIEAIVVDYARPEVVGVALAKVLHLAVYILSIVTLAGLMNLILNGGGVVEGTKKFWAIKGK